MSILKNIKSECMKKGVSISAIETELNFPRGSIFKWEKHIPSVEKVKAVADYIGCSIDDLVSEEKKTG